MSDSDLGKAPGWTEVVAERRIAEAIEDGLFDNLLGKGKPLCFDEAESLVPEHLRIVNHVLKNAKVAPTWILAEREIDEAKAEADRFRDGWLSKAKDVSPHQVVAARMDYERLMRRANDLILRFNLVTPFTQRAPIPFRVKDRLAQWDRSFDTGCESRSDPQ